MDQIMEATEDISSLASKKVREEIEGILQ